MDLRHNFSTFILCLFNSLSFGLSILLCSSRFTICCLPFAESNMFMWTYFICQNRSLLIAHQLYDIFIILVSTVQSSYHLQVFHSVNISSVCHQFCIFLKTFAKCLFHYILPISTNAFHLCSRLFLFFLGFSSCLFFIPFRSLVLLRFQLKIILCNFFHRFDEWKISKISIDIQCTLMTDAAVPCDVNIFLYPFLTKPDKVCFLSIIIMSKTFVHFFWCLLLVPIVRYENVNNYRKSHCGALFAHLNIFSSFIHFLFLI